MFLFFVCVVFSFDKSIYTGIYLKTILLPRQARAKHHRVLFFQILPWPSRVMLGVKVLQSSVTVALVQRRVKTPEPAEQIIN